jgi:hypothetical protein
MPLSWQSVLKAEKIVPIRVPNETAVIRRGAAPGRLLAVNEKYGGKYQHDE